MSKLWQYCTNQTQYSTVRLWSWVGYYHSQMRLWLCVRKTIQTVRGQNSNKGKWVITSFFCCDLDVLRLNFFCQILSVTYHPEASQLLSGEGLASLLPAANHWMSWAAPVKFQLELQPGRSWPLSNFDDSWGCGSWPMSIHELQLRLQRSQKIQKLFTEKTWFFSKNMI